MLYEVHIILKHETAVTLTKSKSNYRILSNYSKVPNNRSYLPYIFENKPRLIFFFPTFSGAYFRVILIFGSAYFSIKLSHNGSFLKKIPLERLALFSKRDLKDLYLLSPIQINGIEGISSIEIRKFRAF